VQEYLACHNPTPPPCIPSDIVPLASGTLRGFDISYVASAIHTYVLAASATVAAGLGPLSNPRIIVADTLTNKVIHEYNASPTFAGSCAVPPARDTFGASGPNGVILIEGSKSRKKRYGDIWAADGPVYSPSCDPTGTLVTPSSVKVLDLNTGATLAVIPTGGRARADELCWSPDTNVVLVANDEPIDNFITFIDEDSYTVIGKISFNGTDPNSIPPGGSPIKANGIEQCKYNPFDGYFYLSLPDIGGGQNGIAGSTGHDGAVVRISAFPPFQVQAVFPIAAATGCLGPQGLSVGPNPQLALGCGSGGPNSLIISSVDGSTIGTVTGQGGADEDWFNPGTGHYYLARSGAAALGVEDSDDGSPTADPTIATAGGSHSVAADSIVNRVYVPIRSKLFGATTTCSSYSGNTADDVKGCIAVYLDVCEHPPSSK
jgi:hypothetical protein